MQEGPETNSAVKISTGAILQNILVLSYKTKMKS